MRYQLIFTALGVLLLSTSAFAGPEVDTTPSAVVSPSTKLVLPSGDQLAAVAADRSDNEIPVRIVSIPDRDPRRAVLSSLHAVTGVVQTYDGLLTLRVLKAGGIETNPLIKPLTRSEGALIGVKVAAAVATVIGAETLWRNNHRVGAIVASVVANSAMAMVAHHNARVLAQLEGRR